jgi:hypothetical protein
MQCHKINRQNIDLTQESYQETFNLNCDRETTEIPIELVDTPPTHFQAHFEGYMEMYADASTVAEYLNAHEGWFCRCAQPMQVEAIDNNGYILTVGKFGSFGYEVEPKIAVVLQPPQGLVYPMYSIPIPNYDSPGYEVDYRAVMELEEVPAEQASAGMAAAYKKQGLTNLPDVITKVKWQLRMDVAVQFPKFIYKLPLSLIQSTGDRLLCQIIRQISPRLTQKVQQDFHSRCNLPLPPKCASSLMKIAL